MEKIALFYNPVSGTATFINKLDYIVYLCQEQGLLVVPFRIRNNEYILNTMRTIVNQQWHTVVAAGGDGTLNQVVNAMMQCGVKAPLALFPEGTSNDVAHYLGIPHDEGDYCRLLTHSRLMKLDLGKIGNRYFVNTASAGFITEAAHGVDQNLKNMLGRFAYFLKGLEMIPSFKSLTMEVEDADGKYYEEEIIFFMVLNSGVAGGFRFLNEENLMSDGKMELLAMKRAGFQNLKQILMKMPKVNFKTINDELLFCCRSSNFRINLEPYSPTDIDGERGPLFPWNIEVIPEAVDFRIPLAEDIK